MIVATAGHIDHGKTVLVHALTGVNTDRLPEEKSRGLSIDLGFAYRSFDKNHTIGFVDVPGHEKFIRNMLAGVTGIDFALLVIAADDGPMPQTREHLAIINLLGVENGAIALTKIDRIDQERRVQVQKEIASLVAETVMENKPIFPCSSQTGEGIIELNEHLKEKALENTSRAKTGRFRMAIDRVFTLAGAGLVVTGTVFSGKTVLGDRLIVSPQGLNVRIRSIHAQNSESELGYAGQRCALNLTGSGIDRATVSRGDWVLDGELHRPTTRIDAAITVLKSERRSLMHWTSVHIHIGAKDVTGRVAVLEQQTIAPGERGLVQLITDEELGCLHGDRLVIRDQSARRTIAGGMVLDPFASERGRRKPDRFKTLRALECSDPGKALGSLLECQRNGVNLSRFKVLWNICDKEAEILWQNTNMICIKAADKATGISLNYWALLKSKCIHSLEAWHQRWPDRPGPEKERLRRSMVSPVDESIFSAVIIELIRAGSIIANGAFLCLPGYKPKFEGKTASLWEQVAKLLVNDSLRPPRTREIAAEVNIDLKKVEELLTRATAMGLVYRISDNRYFLSETVQTLAAIAERIASEADDGMFTAKLYRDNTTIGRNLAIEVLEFFDRKKFTKRINDKRIIECSHQEIFGSTLDKSDV